MLWKCMLADVGLAYCRERQMGGFELMCDFELWRSEEPPDAMVGWCTFFLDMIIPL